MPKKRLPRKFEPRYGVSQAAVDVEAQALGREVEDHKIQSLSELEKLRTERQKICRQVWDHLQLHIEKIPEREQRVLHTLLYRDLRMVLEVYVSYLGHAQSPDAVAIPQGRPAKSVPTEFSEYLF